VLEQRPIGDGQVRLVKKALNSLILMLEEKEGSIHKTANEPGCSVDEVRRRTKTNPPLGISSPCHGPCRRCGRRHALQRHISDISLLHIVFNQAYKYPKTVHALHAQHCACMEQEMKPNLDMSLELVAWI
jgi:hypothetical protein